MWITPSLRIGTAALTAVIVLLSSWTADGVKESARLDSIHTFNYRTQADAALTGWALSRFEQAGLALPPLVISFHDDKQPCDGNFGYYRAGTPARIDICGFNSNRFLITPKKTVLHELGHAWTQYTLNDQTRETFLRFRGLATWNDDDTPWAEQGSEQAAEIVAWALLDQEPSMGKLKDTQPRALAQAYELLTSTQPPSHARQERSP